MRTYRRVPGQAGRADNGRAAIDHGHAIKIAALRGIGESLDETEMKTGARGIGTSAVPAENRTLTPTLADRGIDKKVSMVAQQLAALPEEMVALLGGLPPRARFVPRPDWPQPRRNESMVPWLLALSTPDAAVPIDP